MNHVVSSGLRYFFLLTVLTLSTLFARAQPAVGDTVDTTLRAGEIQLTGTVSAVDLAAGTVTLAVDSFTLPNGKSGQLKAIKPRSIVLGGASRIFVQGDSGWTLPKAALAVGQKATAVGLDGAGGQLLAARLLGVQRMVAGHPMDFFVRSEGSDTGGDGSLVRPWKSIQYAVSQAPDGTAEARTVIHVGPGQFAESFDRTNGQLLIADKQYLTVSGAGARVKGGTQITTGTFAKMNHSGVLKLSHARQIQLCNLVIGEDRSWDDPDAFFQATVDLANESTLALDTVHIMGPQKQTILDHQSHRSPTAIHVGSGDLGIHDARCIANLNNVLITGHGSLLTNPGGELHCKRVTVARLYGAGFDDNVMFLQTPRVAPEATERRYTFEDTLFYELEGRDGGGRVSMTSGEGGADAVYFDPGAPRGGNLLVRVLLGKPDSYYDDIQIANPAFLEQRPNSTLVRAHGVFIGDDSKAPLTGNLRTRNEIKLLDTDDFKLVASKTIRSGWTGGFYSPPEGGIPEVVAQAGKR